MDDLHTAFLHASVAGRLAEADDRLQSRESILQRRAARRARRHGAPLRAWRRMWPWGRPAAGRPTAATRTVLRTAPQVTVPIVVELDRRLEDLAERAAHYGTRSQRRLLDEIAAATASIAPGAAAALVDVRSSEIARLRALGLLHGVALHELPAERQAELLDRLQGTRAAPRALVA